MMSMSNSLRPETLRNWTLCTPLSLTWDLYLREFPASRSVDVEAIITAVGIYFRRPPGCVYRCRFDHKGRGIWLSAYPNLYLEFSIWGNSPACRSVSSRAIVARVGTCFRRDSMMYMSKSLWPETQGNFTCSAVLNSVFEETPLHWNACTPKWWTHGLEHASEAIE